MRCTEYIAWSELANCCCYNYIIITIAKPGKRIGEESAATTYPPCCLGVNAAGFTPFQLQWQRGLAS